MKTAWFTICASNYLGYARTLYESLRAQHSDADFTLFLVDEPSDAADIEALPFRTIPANTLPLQTFTDMTLRYDVMELATAIKPTCFKTLFQNHGFDHAIYLDPDIFILSPLKLITNTLKRGSHLVLTPHILTPYTDDYEPNILAILNSGTYNLGFAAMSNTLTCTNLLDWWQTQLLTRGHNDLSRGMFVDQKYMELAPSFVPNTDIILDRGYNAAYWNLHERPITQKNNKWFAGDNLLAFFHFSGVAPGNPAVFSKHQNRFSTDNIGDLSELLSRYLGALKKNNQLTYEKIPYTYNKFESGETISPLMRYIYANYASEERNHAFNNSTRRDYKTEFFDQPHEKYPLYALLVEAWKRRPDLQKAFNLNISKEREGYIRWFHENGANLFQLPPELVNTLATTNSTNAGTNLLAQGAAKILNAAPSLRPAYKHLPKGVRSFVKTALYRTHQYSTGRNSNLAMNPATGNFDIARQPGIQLYGYVRSQSGIGQGARGFARALKTQALPLGITALANPNDPREAYPYPEIASPKGGFRISLINANAEQVMNLEELVNPRVFDGSYRIAYWVWELAEFPQELFSAISLVDEIWAPSQFVAEGIKHVTQKPVHIIPYAVSQESPAALTRRHFNLPDEKTIFLTAFDVNSFLKRKNPDATIRAFQDAFEPDNPNSPILAIKVHGSKGHSDVRDVLEAHIEGAANIFIIDQTLKRDEYLALHHLADVFVSLHRSEGFGLNIAEAMLIGKPVIATNWSGNTDFMDITNAIPIAAKLVDVPDGAYPYAQGQKWAEANHKDTVTAMQRLAFDIRARERIGKAGQMTIREKYNETAIGNAMRQRLLEIDPGLDQTL